MAGWHYSSRELFPAENASGETRRCARCKKFKPIEDFPFLKVGARCGRQYRKAKRVSYCQPCRKRKSKEDQKRNYQRPEYVAKMRRAAIQSRWKKVLRELGIDEQKYNEMEAAQGGLCAICGEPETARFKGTLRRLCIDHDHETGAVRGLICLDCNAGLGRFKDDPELLREAITYLAAHGRH